MFTADDIAKRVRIQPFVPLRIVTSTGQTYDVHHPDGLFLTRRDVEVGLGNTDNPHVFEEVTRVAILHITEVQDLPVAASSSGNGKPKA